MRDFKYPFDKMLVAVRKFQGVDQTTLANRTGIHRTYISRMETAAALPTWDQLVAIEAALGVKFDDPSVLAAFAILAGNGDSRQNLELPNAQ